MKLNFIFRYILKQAQKSYSRKRLKIFRYLERKLEFEQALSIIATINRWIIRDTYYIRLTTSVSNSLFISFFHGIILFIE